MDQVKCYEQEITKLEAEQEDLEAKAAAAQKAPAAGAIPPKAAAASSFQEAAAAFGGIAGRQNPWTPGGLLVQSESPGEKSTEGEQDWSTTISGSGFFLRTAEEYVKGVVGLLQGADPDGILDATVDNTDTAAPSLLEVGAANKTNDAAVETIKKKIASKRKSIKAAELRTPLRKFHVVMILIVTIVCLLQGGPMGILMFVAVLLLWLFRITTDRKEIFSGCTEV